MRASRRLAVVGPRGLSVQITNNRIQHTPVWCPANCVTMQGIKNALKGVQYSNPAMGERLYELCRKATSRHIDRPDEIINQQVCSNV